MWDDCCDIGPDGGEELPEAAPSASASTLAASRPVQTLPIGPRSRKKASKAPSCNSRSTGCSSAPPPPSACAVPVPAIVTHITFSTGGADEERRAGPKTVLESLDWARRGRESLSFAGGRIFERNLAFLRVSGHCDGMGSLEQIMTSIEAEAPIFSKRVPLECVHASDLLNSRQDCLASLRIGRPSHIHGAIEDRLPVVLREEISALLSTMPTTKKQKSLSCVEKQRAADVMQAIRRKVFAHYEKLGAKDKRAEYAAWCYVHNRRCKLFTGKDGKSAPDDCLTIHAAGAPCEDFTKLGSRLEEAGPSMVAFWSRSAS